MKILITIYDFPPYVTGGSVLRTIKYIKYLKPYGIDFTVLTAKRKILVSKNAFSEILNEIEVIYIEDPIQNIFDKAKSVSSESVKSNIVKSIVNLGKKNIKRILNNILIPDKGYFWYKKSYKAIMKLHDIRNFDIIYASFPEPSALWLGYKISIKTNLPLVLDFRDLWSTNPLFRKTVLITKYTRRLEKRILKKARSIIFATEMARDIYIREGMVNKDKTCILWNGFDPDDFSLSHSCVSIMDKSVFNFTYAGNTGNLSDPARNPKIMIDAFIAFAKNVSNVRLNFIGNLPSDVINYVSGKKEIMISGMLKHSDVGQILKDSDVLLVILTKYEDLSAVPGKVYEYMAAGKYILALTSKESQLAHLISMYKYGSIVNPDSFDEIISKMQEARNIVKERVEIKPDSVFVEKFNRQNAAESLKNIFQSVVKDFQ